MRWDFSLAVSGWEAFYFTVVRACLAVVVFWASRFLVVSGWEAFYFTVVGKFLPSRQLSWVCAQTTVERIVSSWKGPFCTSMLVGMFLVVFCFLGLLIFSGGCRKHVWIGGLGWAGGSGWWFGWEGGPRDIEWRVNATWCT